MIKNFSCFRVEKKEKDSEPDYRLSANVGTKESPKYVECGAGWIKQGEHTKYISFKLSDAFKERSGFVLMEEKGTIPKTKEEEDSLQSDDKEIPF